MEVQYNLYNVIFVTAWLSWFVLFTIGWIKDFPKWTVHSISYCIIMSLLLINVTSPSLGRYEPWGWLALLPLIISVLIGISVNRFKKPTRKLADQFKQNNSRILFMFYGILPFANAIIFDEIIDKRLPAIYLSLITIIVVCTLIYLNAENKKLRNWSLVFGFFGTIIIAIFVSPHLEIYQP